MVFHNEGNKFESRFNFGVPSVIVREVGDKMADAHLFFAVNEIRKLIWSTRLLDFVFTCEVKFT